MFELLQLLSSVVLPQMANKQTVTDSDLNILNQKRKKNMFYLNWLKDFSQQVKMVL